MFVPEHIYQKGAQALQVNQESGLGSHLQAGARAQVIDSPLTQALSTRRGRMLAQTMRYVFRGNVQALLNYAAIRPYAMMEAIRIALGTQPQDKIVLDPATGYSPDFYWLAEEFPDTQFVEVDVHDVIEHKRAAYHDLGIPANLRLRSLDLREQQLHAVQTERVDVMITLGAYVTHADFRDLLTYLQFVLKEDAFLVAAFPYTPGIDNFTDNSFIFSNIVTTPRGALKNEDELQKIFKDTGFTIQETIKLSDFASKLGKPIPADIEMVAIVQRDGDV